MHEPNLYFPMTIEDQKIREPTVFSSRIVLLFVGVFLFIALVYRQNNFALLAILILTLMGGARVWTHRSADRLRCDSAVDNDRVFPGDAITLATTVENGKWLPIWLRIMWSFDGALEPVGEKDNICRQEAALLWHQTVKFHQAFKAMRRGVYQLGPPVIRTSDFFGFFEKETNTQKSNHVIVYPQLVPLRPLTIRRRDLYGVPGSRSPVKDPVYILGTCDYQPSRPSRHIHWKASARHCRLQEKIFEPSEQEKVLLTLDVESFENSKREDEFEQILEVIASLAVGLDRKGYAVGFAANGILSGGSSALIPLGRGPRQIPAILETLARIQAKPKGSVKDITRQFLGSRRGISCVYFCSDDDSSVSGMELFFQKKQIPVSFILCRRNPEIRNAGGKNRYTLNEIRLYRSPRHESL